MGARSRGGATIVRPSVRRGLLPSVRGRAQEVRGSRAQEMGGRSRSARQTSSVKRLRARPLRREESAVAPHAAALPGTSVRVPALWERAAGGRRMRRLRCCLAPGSASASAPLSACAGRAARSAGRLAARGGGGGRGPVGAHPRLVRTSLCPAPVSEVSRTSVEQVTVSSRVPTRETKRSSRCAACTARSPPTPPAAPGPGATGVTHTVAGAAVQ